MIADVWSIHIIPILEIEDVFAFYCTCSRAAALVELARNWVDLYKATFDGVYVDAGSPFLSYWCRHNAKIIGPDARITSSCAKPVKTVCSSFERSMLAVLDTAGTLHGVDSQLEPLKQIFGLDHYLYGIGQNGTVSAWTSRHTLVRFEMDVKMLKTCSVGYLCAALGESGVYWWQRPHGPHSKMEYERVSVPLHPDDIAVTRYGIVLLAKGELYQLRLLDTLLRPTTSSLEYLGRGYTHLEQSGEWFVAHASAQNSLVGNGIETHECLENVQSLQVVGSNVYTLSGGGVLRRNGEQQPGLYGQIAALDDIYALRVL